jgi:hypothetical protein
MGAALLGRVTIELEIRDLSSRQGRSPMQNTASCLLGYKDDVIKFQKTAFVIFTAQKKPDFTRIKQFSHKRKESENLIMGHERVSENKKECPTA